MYKEKKAVVIFPNTHHAFLQSCRRRSFELRRKQRTDCFFATPQTPSSAYNSK